MANREREVPRCPPGSFISSGSRRHQGTWYYVLNGVLDSLVYRQNSKLLLKDNCHKRVAANSISTTQLSCAY